MVGADASRGIAVRRQRRVVTWGILVGLYVTAGCGRGGNAARGGGSFQPLELGDQVPLYAIATLRGDTARVGSGEPVTVLNVWATWCTSCREEMETLDSLYDEFARRGVRVLAVSVDRGGDAVVRRYAEHLGLRMSVAHDAEGVVQDRFRILGVPTTFIIDSTGTLRWRRLGSVIGAAGEARAELKRILAGREVTGEGVRPNHAYPARGIDFHP